jgi:hypothetical protein
MADTGNPWFIPFAEPSDLVRDWPALSSAVGTAVAAGLSVAGGVKQVKSATATTNTTTTSTSMVDAGISLAFTPTSSTSLLVVQWSGIVAAFTGGANQISRKAFVRLVQVGGSAIPGAEFVYNGRDLSASSTGSAAMFGSPFVRGFVSAGSTDARTYRLEFSVDPNVTVEIFNTDCTGRLSVIEYGAGVL